MKLSKSRVMSLIVALIVLIVYNVIAFVLPFDKGAGFWLGYAFSLFAILLTVIVLFYTLRHESMRSRFYRLSFIYIVWIYLVVQVIVSLVEMGFEFIPPQYPLILNLVLLVLCLIGLISAQAGIGEVERLDDKVKEKSLFLNSLQADVVGLVEKVQGVSLKKDLVVLADTIRYSDPMSSPQLAPIENEIEAKVAALIESVGRLDAPTATALCEELQQLFAERNRQCKLLK